MYSFFVFLFKSAPLFPIFSSSLFAADGRRRCHWPSRRTCRHHYFHQPEQDGILQLLPAPTIALSAGDTSSAATAHALLLAFNPAITASNTTLSAMDSYAQAISSEILSSARSPSCRRTLTEARTSPGREGSSRARVLPSLVELYRLCHQWRTWQHAPLRQQHGADADSMAEVFLKKCWFCKRIKKGPNDNSVNLRANI